MEILRRPVHELTFADVEEFCQRGIPEGTQIDYKKDLSQKGLAKHFAAFSNARGGLIIIGVEEDATCKPSKWEGVNPADKYEERIHQQAKDVDPIPRYEVFTTNTGTNGNVFVLVRIQEGDLTPYYVQNDANIYMRTGNITKLCTELASPQETARLFGKRENAQLAREAWLKRAELLYDSTIARFHKQHEKWHKINISNTVYAPIPVHKSAILTAFIQPYFPNQNLTSPQELQVILNDLRYAQERKRIYWLNSNQEMVQDGVLCSDSRIGHSSHFQEYQVVFASGLIYGRSSVYTHSQPGKVETIYLERVVDDLYHYLSSCCEIYKSVRYQGNLLGQIQLSGLDGLQVMPFRPTQEHRYDPKDILQPEYTWSITTDTTILFDTESRKTLFSNLVNEIGWSFGYDYDHTNFLNYHIEQKGWFS